VPSQDKRLRKKENARLAREARIAAEKRRRRLRSVRNAAIAVAAFVLIIVVVNLLTGDDKKKVEVTTSTTTPPTTIQPKVKLTGFVAAKNKTYTATIQTNLGRIVIAMDSKNAPKAAGRFIELARKGFYNGLTWHRAVKDFVIQGGDPEGTGSGGSGNPPVKGEVPTDHYPVGSLAAAKGGNDPAGTFDSQFFIVTGSKGATLDNDYARFGSVTSGIDVAKRIEGLAPASGDGPPTGKATIDKVTITES
jgi:peptidyl-prolyl cis-trans isomerase B (cyclophilin B)